MFQKAIVIAGLAAGVLSAAAGNLTLDVTFDQQKTVKVGGKDVVLDGTFKTLEKGEKVMAFGKKAYLFPAKGLVTEQGTLVFDFATEVMRNSKSSARTLLFLRSNSRLLLGFSTYKSNPYIQFAFTDQTHKFYFSPKDKIVPGKLSQAVMTWDGKKVCCYWEGKLVKEVDQPAALNVKALTFLYVGPHRDNWYLTHPWDDDTLAGRVRVYDYALTAEEVQKLSAK